MLVSRNLEKLNATAKEIQLIGNETGREVKTRVIVLDFVAAGSQRASTYERVFDSQLSDIDVSILVNNAGYAHTGPFTEISDDDVHKQLTCNTYPVALLTQQVIKSFEHRWKTVRKRSLLVSTSSIAALIPIPFAATYSATKHFVDFLTWALGEELAPHYVDVCAWNAATVKTKMTNYSKSRFAVTPETYARQAFSKCTSGAHAGAHVHDIIITSIKNLLDVLPLPFILGVVGGNAKKAGDRVKSREEAKKRGSPTDEMQGAPKYTRLD